MAGIFGGGDPYAGSGQAAYNQQQPSFAGYDYPNNYPMTGSDYGGGGDYGGYTSYGGGMGSPTDPGAGYYDTGGGTATSSGGGILDWLGSEKGQRALQQLGGFSSGMLAGSAPSLQPRNFYTGLGAGMEGMQKAGSQYYQDALYRARAEKSAADVANLRASTGLMLNEAANATGLPPGYGAAPGYGSSGAPAVAPAGAGGGGGGQGGWGPLAQPAIGALSAAGVSPAGQQAIMGHGLAEGGFNNPWRVGDQGNSFGHWQFNKGGELPGYTAWAQGKGDPQDTALQAQYVAKRMEEIHPGFSKVTDPAQAMAMVADFERYKGYQTNKRLGYLADAQKAMGGGELAPRLPIPPGYGQKPTFADTPFQMPPNMAAGLNAPLPGAPGPGILPPPPAVPGVTQPGAASPLVAGGGMRSVAPAATVPPEGPAAAAPPAEPPPTTGTSAPAAARVAAAGAPSLAEGDSIAYRFQKFGGLPGNPKGGRNPQQVLDNIDGNLKRDPDYYRGKTVMLSSGVMNGPGRIDLVPEQIQRIQDAGGKVILAGVDTGKFAGHNGTLAQMAAEAGVPFAGALPTDNVHPGPDGYRQYLARVRRGAAQAGGGEGGGPGPTQAPPGAGELDVGQAVTAGGGGSEGVPPAEGGLTAGRLIPGIRTPAEVAAAPVLPASSVAPAPLITAGPTAPVSPPPAPDVTVAPPAAPPGPSPAVATAGPAAVPVPVVPTPPPPLAVPNLGQVQPPGMGGIPPYDVEAARRAQVLAIAGAMSGRPVPAYLAERANLPNKAVEQQWARQAQLYGAQLEAARDQWKSMDTAQQAATAQRYNLTRDQYKAELDRANDDWKQGRMFNPQTQRVEEVPGAAQVAAAAAGAVAQAQKNAEALAEFDRPREYKVTDDAGKPSTIIATPRQMGATPPSTLGAARAPGGTQAPGTPGGYQSGIAPGREAELTGEGKRLAEVATQVHSEAQTAVNSRADLEFLSALGPNISAPGPWASAMQSFNRVRQSVLGTAAEPVASYELAQQLMGGMMRTALRASDPNPTERQQAMMLASMPTPASSAEGFLEGIRHMQGLADYKVFKQQALINWQRDHDGSAAGFEGSFKLSAIPFVLDRMSSDQQTAYFAKLKAKDPKALDRLGDQIEAVKNLNYTYKY